jgi:hypothetical protein
MPDTLGDGGYQTGSYDVTIGGYSYTLDTVDHELPIGQADAMNADGTPAGGAFVRMKEKVAVKIKAVTGTPAPSQLVPFALSFHGYPSKNWVIATMKITSSNEGAQIRTYNADIVEYINSI